MGGLTWARRPGRIGPLGQKVYRLRDYARSPGGGALIGVLVTLALLLPLWWQVGRWYQAQLLAELRAQAAVETSLRGNTLSVVINRPFARLQGLYAFTQTEAAAENFETFAAELYTDSKGVRNFAVAPGGVMDHVYPLAGNEAVVGHNLLDDPRPNVRADVERAIRSRVMTLSGPYPLQQGGFGLVARLAVYQEDAFWGFVTMALDVPALLEEAGLMAGPGALTFALRDGTGVVFYGPAAVFEDDPVIQAIDLPEGLWQLAGVPPEGWQEAARRELLIFQGAGLTIVGLIVSVVFLSINHQARLARAVQQRTQEILNINQKLERDIIERKRVEAALREREEQYRSIFESTTDGVFINDLATGRLVDFNPAACRMHGYTPQEFRQLQPFQFIHPDSYHLFTEYIEAVKTGGQFRAQAIDLHKDGTPFHIEVFGTRFTYRGQPHSLAIVRDISEEVQAHQLLARRVEERTHELYEQARALASLEERQRLARELHDSLSQALYGIALGAQTARTWLDRDPDRAAEPLDYVLSLSEAGLAEMRAMIFELRPESLETEGLVAALAKQAASLRARHGLEVQTHFCAEPSTPLAVKEALYRIAREGLHNIVKHARAEQVTVRLEAAGGALILELQDDGIGFDPDGSFPGHLGLHSMGERAEQLGGSFRVESEPGGGTRIRVHIPLEPRNE